MITINGKTYTAEQWEQHQTDEYGPKGPPIDVDEQAILALEQVTTGADIHDTIALIEHYKSFCKLGRQKGAEAAKRAMYERAILLFKRGTQPR